MKILHGSGTRSRLSEFNKVRYSELQLKKKYNEYVEHSKKDIVLKNNKKKIQRDFLHYGAEKLYNMKDNVGLQKFIKIWQYREKQGLSSLDISKKTQEIGEQTVRHILRFLEREYSLIKDILAGKKISNTPNLDTQTEMNKKTDSFDEKDKPSGSRTSLTNDQILFFIENCNHMSFKAIARKFIEDEGSLEVNDENIDGINEKVKNLNDRLKGNVKQDGKIFTDSEMRIATNVNNAIKKGLIKYSNGRVMTTTYSYVEKKGWEKSHELALQSAQPWLDKAEELLDKENLSSRKLSEKLRKLGFNVGKTSVLKYINNGYLKNKK